MDQNRMIRAGLSVSIALAFCSGCGKKADPAATSVTMEQVPATIEKAFSAASEEVKRQAAEAAKAVQSQNDSAAFVQLESLSGRPDLTPEQRRAAFDSWMAVNVRLNQAAAEGNNAAKELLEKYRATK